MKCDADRLYFRWDDWVPQERLRKLNEENKELANNLKKDMDAQRKAATSKPIAPMQKKRPYGSDLTGSSARGSEDRSSAAPPAPPRGTKRGREIEGIDKVSHSRVFVVCTFSAVSAVSVVRPPLPIFIICSSRTALAPLSAVLVVMAPTKRPASTHPPRARQLLKTSQPAVSRSALSRAVEQRGVLTQSSKQEEEFVRRPAVRILMPDSLKSILVDDWEKVTKEQKLAQVPSPTPASQFLNDYYSAEANTREPNSADADILEEVIAGVKEYFNKSLGRILLYRFERQQFYDVHKSIESGSGEHTGKTLCEMYGCEHLLRLFGTCEAVCSSTSLLTFCSLHARSYRSHEHGCAICQPSTGGADEDDFMDGEAHSHVSFSRVRACWTGIPRQRENRDLIGIFQGGLCAVCIAAGVTLGEGLAGCIIVVIVESFSWFITLH